MPHRLEDDVAHRRLARVLGAHDPAVDEELHHALIVCDLGDLTAADEVGARVADLGDVRSTRADEHGRERRAHPCLRALALLSHGLVGTPDGLRQGRIARRLERSIGESPG